MADIAGRRQTLETPNVILNPYRFAAAVAADPPAINNRVVAGTGTASGTTYTLANYVVSAGDNRVLLVWVSNEDSTALSAISGVTFGGVAMSLISSVTVANIKLWCYALVAPTVSAADIVVTFDATSSGDFSITACYLTGANQTTYNALDTDTETTSNKTLEFAITTSVAECVGILVAVCEYAYSFSQATDWTEVVDQTIAGHRLAVDTRDLTSATTYSPEVAVGTGTAPLIGICLAWGPA